MTRRSLFFTAALASIALAVTSRPAAAAWPHDPTSGNVALCIAAGDQVFPAIVSDGAGGAIVAWEDRAGAGYDYNIYAQRISAAGVPLWTANGVALCTAAGVQSLPAIASDGAGGAIVTWSDGRSGNTDIYAQRIGPSGVVQWTADGVALCSAPNNQDSPTIMPDAAGGAIIAWFDTRGGTSGDIYAQRIGASGVVQWTAQGVALCTATGQQSNPRAVPDGAGGVIVAWEDTRGAVSSDLYAQRIGAGGAVQWPANGVAVCTEANDQGSPAITSDGAGGAIVTWWDFRSGNYDLYAQRVGAAGVALWTANGVALCVAAAQQTDPAIVPDGAGGAVVVWQDDRGGNNDIYAQRVGATGVARWTANGVALCAAGAEQTNPTAVPDGAGGAIFAWQDYRNGNVDIYAQRVSGSGTAQWTADGAALCSAPFFRYFPAIATDGAGGAIVAWHDLRSGSNTDIYAQRIERFGLLGSPEPVISSVLDIPNDQGGCVRLTWEASYLDLEYSSDLSAYDLFHSVPPNVAQEAIERGEGSRLGLDEVPAAGRRAILFTTFGSQQYAWEYIGTVNPQHFIATYGSTQATTGDSIAGSNPTTSFMVVGRSYDHSKYWLSAPAAGYSVDNLAPAAPAPFTGQYVAGTTALHWNRNTEADLAGYRLYRGKSTAFVPSPANLVGALPDTGYVDAAGAPYVYKLTAVDVHGNESPVATLVPSGALGVGGSAPLALAFAAPSPNPARGATTLRWTLSRSGPVRLAVYDAAGRRVAVLRDGDLPAGEHAATFALRDEAGRDLPSGLYLLRLEAEGRLLVRRLAAIR
jgi:hypothetical protein